jgi:hypothetical protein
VHHTILEAQFDIQNTTVVENDQNSLWKDTNDDCDDLVLQMRKRFDDIKNEKKKSRDLIEKDKIKEVRQVMTKKRKQLQMTKFHAMQNLWRFVVKFLTIKIEHLNLCDLKCWACVEWFLIHVNNVFMIVFMIISWKVRNLYLFCLHYFYDSLYDNLLKIS